MSDTVAKIQAPAGFKSHTVGHHFRDANQEFASAQLGMWIFIGQEVLFFSALFVAYGVFRLIYPEMYVYASGLLNWKLGLLNTVVLLFSSFTMAMAIHSIQRNKKNLCLIYLGITQLCAAAFMVVKYFEYSHKIHDGLLPAKYFSGTIPLESVTVDGINSLMVFFGLYFSLTGLHGIHILIGMGLILWIMIKVAKGNFFSGYFTPVELVGLYWHLVDIIWIFLFPLLYLI